MKNLLKTLLKRDILILTTLFMLFTAALYGAFYLKDHSLVTVYKNWDGPGYVMAAMSMYVPKVAYEHNIVGSVDIHPYWTWLPAEFPLYPLAIRLFSFLGYFKAMLWLSVLGSLVATIAFYELATTVCRKPYALRLAIIFMLIPPRWFIVSHVGTAESWFMAFLILFLMWWQQGKMGWAAGAAALAEASHPRGALLMIAIGIGALVEIIKNRRQWLAVVRRYVPFLVVPATLLAVFTFYKVQTGDFYAFFSAIKLFQSTTWLPFQTFTYPNTNIETFWQEANALYYVLYLAAPLMLIKTKYWRLAVYGLVYFVPLIFLRHSDISRYALPLVPVFLVAFHDIFEQKAVTWAALLMSPAVMMYAFNFMMWNHAA